MTYASDTLTGTVGNAKAGAILVLDNGNVLYISGLHAWPSGLDGEQVVVTGRVGETDHVPVATKGADGGWSQGKTSPGSDTVVFDATWERVASLEAAEAGRVEPPPWSVVYADGSGNLTRLSMTDETIAWETEPVQPENSSTGTYSGGTPGAGVFDADVGAQIWVQLRALEATVETHAENRAMGTGGVTVVTLSGTRNFVLTRTEELTAFEALLAEACRSSD